jgi:hypothetical protein
VPYSYSDPTTDDKLGQIEAALALLQEQIAGLRRSPAPQIYGVDPALRAGPLAEALWQKLGRRKALVVRTRLSQRAEREDGHRQYNGNGRDHVARGHNGNGHARVEFVDGDDVSARTWDAD